ncbi:MAG: 30S ribosomal protein S11 [Deltaproteobacteria bacterium]|nr:30S ribosomal protein S11 [Deltaproteobacteria bacterium]
MRGVDHGVAHIQATYTNTIVTIADTAGNVISWGTAGGSGFRGSRKSTPYAASVAAEKAAQKAIQVGVKSVAVQVKGPGPGREAAVRSLHAAGLKVTQIKDVTPLPHNGCRPPKRRRT